jgi:hypothetical protein
MMGVRGNARSERTAAFTESPDDGFHSVEVPILDREVVNFEAVDLPRGGSDQ